MNQDELSRWLRRAEAELAAPPGRTPDLLARAAARQRQRQRGRWQAGTLGVVSALVMVGIGSGWWLWPRGGIQPVTGPIGGRPAPGPFVVEPVPPSLSTADRERLRRDADLLGIEADSRSRVALRLADELRRQRAAAQEPRVVDPRVAMAQQCDEAAFTVLNQGDRFYHELADRESAADAYREVIRAFPDSYWSRLAEQRLAALQANPGGSS